MSTVPRVLRIAMWSGPRNISTALMRAWGNRPDTHVVDEPFYAVYLAHARLEARGIDHPVADEIVRSYPTDWKEVVASLLGEVPDGKAVFYQKQMAHHLLPHVGREWLASVRNCFLIREPRAMLTSLVKVLPRPTVADTGLPQQLEIFRRVCDATGRVPPVLDSRDVLEDPRRLLGLLCRELGVEFSEAMLSWPPGRRDTDGIWAPYWYGEVEKSTGFRPYASKPEEVPLALAGVLAECEEHYRELQAHRLGRLASGERRAAD
jgi:hypothetical protein